MMGRFFGAISAALVTASIFSTSAFANQWVAKEVVPAGTIQSAADMPMFQRCGKELCQAGFPYRIRSFVFPKGAKPAGDAVRAPKGAKSQIRSTWYEDPTRRYAHAILGDDIEAGTIAARTKSGAVVRFVLPQSDVFEDQTPRLADINGDGELDIVTIQSNNRKGASIAVYGINGKTLTLIAQSPYIGRANRWMNVAGIADFTGGGKVQIAAVTTPHIGGTLNIWEQRGSRLVAVASQYGFSNHAIGSRVQKLSAVADFNGDGVKDLALPANDHSQFHLISFVRGKFKKLAKFQFKRRIDRPVTIWQWGPRSVIGIGLSDGSVRAIYRSK
ncbi:MAG: VCBS repeat-containing protein [Pseudomonadota bacterium]